MSDDPITALPPSPDRTGRAAAASASGLVPTIHHANIKTNRLDELIDWYGKVVGMVSNFRWEGGAFITNDAANHRLAIFATPYFSDDPDRPYHAGLHHLAFEFPTTANLLDHFAALREVGIRPAFAVNHGVTTSFYYKDPDANFVELQVDNFGDWEKSTEFVQTSDAFAENPAGVVVNPDALYDAKQAGASAAELNSRSYAGEFPETRKQDYGLPVEMLPPHMVG